jgi:hypothetical protein
MHGQDSHKMRRAAMTVGFVMGSSTEIATLGLCSILPHDDPIWWLAVLAWAVISSVLCILVMQASVNLTGKPRTSDRLNPLEITFLCSHVITLCVMRSVGMWFVGGLNDCFAMNYLASFVYVSIGVYGLKKSWTEVENEYGIIENLKDNTSTV